MACIPRSVKLCLTTKIHEDEKRPKWSEIANSKKLKSAGKNKPELPGSGYKFGSNRGSTCGFCSHGGQEIFLAKKRKRSEDNKGTKNKGRGVKNESPGWREFLEEIPVLVWVKNEAKLGSFL